VGDRSCSCSESQCREPHQIEYGQDVLIRPNDARVLRGAGTKAEGRRRRAKDLDGRKRPDVEAASLRNGRPSQRGNLQAKQKSKKVERNKVVAERRKKK
jgi:hypothetical protein